MKDREKNDDFLNELMIAESNIIELQSWQTKAQKILAQIPPENRMEIDKRDRKALRRDER